MHYIDELLDLLRKLRDPNSGCPWDIKQTHESLAPFIVEEAWEVVSAIKSSDQSLEEELGDVLMNVLFHCQIASEHGKFDFKTVCEKLAQKIIKKHPHVFSSEDKRVTTTEEEVLKNWEKIDENKQPGNRLDSISKSLPATIRAKTASERAKRLGIFFTNEQEVWSKIDEELGELKRAKSKDEFESEVGDLLFTLVELCRFKEVDPEVALNRSTDKFIARVKAALQFSENHPEGSNSKETWELAKRQ